VSSVIHRGSTFTFDDAFCRCDTLDTSGQFAKCPVCHPERYTDGVRLLAWLEGHDGRTDPAWLPAWRHVWTVAGSWLDPPPGGYPIPFVVRRIRADLASGDQDRIRPWLADPDATDGDRRMTAEATRAVLWDGTDPGE
jgi:hypothetical protein